VVPAVTVARLLQDLLEVLVGLLGGERGEHADEVQAAPQHGRELPREEHQRGEPHAARQPAEGEAEPRDGRPEVHPAGQPAAGGPHGHHDPALRPQPHDEVALVLRLQPAPAQRTRAVRGLVLEDGHRLS
jgi:hypothetical protein